MVVSDFEIVTSDNFKTGFLVKGNCTVISLPHEKPYSLLIVMLCQFQIVSEKFITQFETVKFLQQVKPFQFCVISGRKIRMGGIKNDF